MRETPSGERLVISMPGSDPSSVSKQALTSVQRLFSMPVSLVCRILLIVPCSRRRTNFLASGRCEPAGLHWPLADSLSLLKSSTPTPPRGRPLNELARIFAIAALCWFPRCFAQHHAIPDESHVPSALT